MLDIALQFVIIIVGLAILVKGADVLVAGAADVARWLRISPIIVGLTIVAFGTSLPEFIVSLFSVLSGSADISVGNIIGSNIANIALIIGVAACITPLTIKSKTLIHEFPFLLVSTFLFVILSVDLFIFNKDTFTLGRIDGFILLVFFAFFLYYIHSSMKAPDKSIKKEFSAEFKHKNQPWKNTLLILLGIMGLVLGGKIFLVGAENLANMAGLSQAFIGTFIAAVGTSLPELAASGMAAWRKHGDIAIGNIIGSNIFNILMVGGIVSLVKPFPISSFLLSTDAIIMIFVTLLFLLFATKGKKITRTEGILLLIVYLLYVVFLIWRL